MMNTSKSASVIHLNIVPDPGQHYFHSRVQREVLTGGITVSSFSTSSMLPSFHGRGIVSL